MVHSGYVAQAKMANNYVRERVQYRGLNTAGGWIRNPVDVQQKFVARITSMAVGIAMDREYSKTNLDGKFHPEDYIRNLEVLAYASQTGNCSELSAVAFKYLERQSVRSIDYFAVYRGSWNHAFVVLNRDASTPVTDFATWSEMAVVCDPLYGREDIAGNLARWYPKMFPLHKNDVMYRVE